jgi:hypothetical protein
MLFVQIGCWMPTVAGFCGRMSEDTVASFYLAVWLVELYNVPTSICSLYRSKKTFSLPPVPSFLGCSQRRRAVGEV